MFINFIRRHLLTTAEQTKQKADIRYSYPLLYDHVSSRRASKAEVESRDMEALIAELTDVAQMYKSQVRQLTEELAELREK